MNIQVRVITAQARARIRQLEAEIARLNGMMAAGNAASAGFLGGRQLSNLTKFGNQLQWTGRQLQYNFTLPIILAGAAAAKFALDNEKAFTRISKVYGDASLSAETMQNELVALRGSFVALSEHYGVHQKEVLAIAADWAAAGASGVALARSVESTLKTMVLGELEAADATDALIAIQAQYNLSSKELTETIAKLNVIENQTGASMAGLIQGFSRTAGVARSAGIDVDHLGAFIAALTPAAGSAAQAGNGLKTIISRLLAPTGEAVDILGAMGVNITDLAWKSANGSQRIELLSKKFHGLDDAQKAVVSSTLASRYQINRFDVLMDSVYKSVDNNAKTTGYYGKALEATADRASYLAQAEKELNAVLQSNPQKLKQIWVILENAMADIIIPLIPVILMAANALRAMAQGFRDLPPEVQKLLTYLLLFLALFGPLLRYLGSTITLIQELKWVFFGLGNSAIWAVTGIASLIALPFKILAGGFTMVWVSAFKLMGMLGSGLLGAAMAFAARFPALMAGALMPVRAVWVLAGRAIVAIWAGTMGGLALLTGPALTSIQAAFILWRNGMVTTMVLVRTAIVGGWVAALAAFRFIIPALSATMTTVWAAMVAISRAGAMAVVLITRGMALAMLTSVRTLPRLMMAYFIFMWTGIVAITRGGVVALGRMMLAAVAALTGPWGAAIAVIVAVIVVFRKQIRQIIQNVIDYFNALPEGVYSALRGVVEIVKAAALAVYGWFQYLNPFAHHSPSLVENVTKGMAEVKKQISSITDISGPINRAYQDIKRFGNATKSLKNGMDSAKRADDRATLKKVSPGAVGEFDTLVGDLSSLNSVLARLDGRIKTQQGVVDAWKAKLDAANKTLDTANDRLDVFQSRLDAAQDKLQGAQEVLSKYASTPITGMKAMSDAIFENEMAQKKLRLEMLKMEDTTGPIDDVKSKLDKLRGEIELVSGTQKDLRSAGAGSDILSTYDDQIKGLQGQQKAIEGSTKQYDDLSKALDDLARKGEMLDLENSLKFDPLTRQIDEAANAMEEMPFGKIMAGVQQAQADIVRYAGEVDRASDAVDRQKKVVDDLTKARDALSDRVDHEEAQLAKLKDAYDSVQDAIRDIESALNDVTSAAEDALRRAKDAADKAKGSGSPALDNFRNAKGGNFPDVGGSGKLGREGGPGDQSALIDQYTKDLAKQTGDMLGGFDVFKPIKDKWNQFTAWYRKVSGPFWDGVRDFLNHVFDGVDFSGALKTFDLKPLKTLWKTAQDIYDTLAGWVKDLWDLLGPELMDSLKQIWEGLKSIWESIQPELSKFRELGQPIADSLKNLWIIAKPILALLGLAILLIIKVVWSMLNGAIKPVFEAIGGILGGFVQVIRGVVEVVTALLTGDWKLAFKGMFDIVKGTWDMIWSLLKGVVKTIWGLIKGFVTGIYDFFKWLYDKLVGHSVIPDLVRGIFTWFKKLSSLPKWIWDNVLKKIYDFAKKLWDSYLKPFLKAVVDGWFAIFKGLWKLGSWIWDNVLKPAYVRVKSIWADYIKPYLKNVVDGWFSIFRGLFKLDNWLWDNAFKPIYEKFKALWNTYLKPFGNSMVRGFANIFNAVGNAMVKGVNIGINAINKMIGGLNWIGSHVPGLNFKVGTIGTASYNPWKPPQFAKGGSLPMSEVGAGFKTNGVRAIVGEGSHHPEYVIPTDPKYRTRAAGLMTQAAKSMGISQFAKGGVLGSVGNAISSAISTGKDYLKAGAIKIAMGPVNTVVQKLIGKIPDKLLMRDLAQAMYSKFKSYVTGVEEAVESAGGTVNPGLAGALNWAKGQSGKPYIWGAVGPNGYDCSGFMSAITNVIQGKKNIYARRFATGNFPTSDFAPGMGAFSIGSRRGNPGHMAGTLNGVNVESSGDRGVHYGPGARGAKDSLFTTIQHLKGYFRGGVIGKQGGDPAFDLLNKRGKAYVGKDVSKEFLSSFDSGGFLKPGEQKVVNATRKPEPVLTSSQWDSMMELAKSSSSVGTKVEKLTSAMPSVDVPKVQKVSKTQSGPTPAQWDSISSVGVEMPKLVSTVSDTVTNNSETFNNLDRLISTVSDTVTSNSETISSLEKQRSSSATVKSESVLTSNQLQSIQELTRSTSSIVTQVDRLIPAMPAPQVLAKTRAADMGGGSGNAQSPITPSQWDSISRLAASSNSVGPELPKMMSTASTVATGGSVTRASVRTDALVARAGESVTPGGTTVREIHFHGDLSFPNIKNGTDAERFISNLEILAKGA